VGEGVEMEVEVVPHVRIGEVRLGMPREEADRLREKLMGLDSAGTPPLVTFIDVHWRIGARYRGINLFAASADEVVAAVARLEGLDPLDYPPGKHHYRFPALNMLLWRGEVSDEPGTQGFTFQSVSIHVPDYYQGTALRAILRETTHRPLPPPSVSGTS
jgi:hypothetical protein